MSFFILADDLGWADLGCYGADLHETPHLDRFAREAVRFTQAYAMSVCSPTRATLMTGQIRGAAALHRLAGRRDRRGTEGPQVVRSPVHLQSAAQRDNDRQTPSVGRLFTALVGKWHLGDWQHYPETHGFDVNIGGTGWGAPETFFGPTAAADITGRSSAMFRIWSLASPANSSPTGSPTRR